MANYPTTLAALDVPMPAELAGALALEHELGRINFTNPVAALEQGVADGTITADTAAGSIEAALSGYVLAKHGPEVAQALHPALERRIRRVTAATGDEVITAARPRFDQAITDLTATVERFGIAPTAESVIAHPGGAELWAGRLAAIATLAHVDFAQRHLARVGYYAEPSAVTVYLAAVTTRDRLEVAKSTYLGDEDQRFERLIAAGFALRLNTATEAAAITRTIAEAQAAAAAEREARVAAAHAEAKAQREQQITEGMDQAKSMRKRVGITR